MIRQFAGQRGRQSYGWGHIQKTQGNSSTMVQRGAALDMRGGQ